MWIRTMCLALTSAALCTSCNGFEDEGVFPFPNEPGDPAILRESTIERIIAEGVPSRVEIHVASPENIWDVIISSDGQFVGIRRGDQLLQVKSPAIKTGIKAVRWLREDSFILISNVDSTKQPKRRYHMLIKREKGEWTIVYALEALVEATVPAEPAKKTGNPPEDPNEAKK